MNGTMKHLMIAISIGVSYLCAMESQKLYVKITHNAADKEGFVVAFAKEYLPQLKTFQIMQEDFPQGGAIDDPFPVPYYNMTPEEFQSIISLLQLLKKTTSTTTSVTDTMKIIWKHFKLKSDRYAILAQLIKTGDYLAIDHRVASALKLCISTTDKSMYEEKEPETIDQALEAGLKNINTLNPPSLFPIKETMVELIRSRIEKIILKKANDETIKHQTIIREIQLSPGSKIVSVNYVKLLNHSKKFFVALTYSKSDGKTFKGCYIFDLYTNKVVSVANKPAYNFMYQIPNQHLLPDGIRKYDININTAKAASIRNDISFYYSQELNNFIYHILTVQYRLPADQHSLLIGTTYIGNEIAIPDAVTFFDTYTDSHGIEKFIAVVANGGLFNRIITIDPALQEAKIFKTFEKPEFTISSACVSGSKLILGCFEKLKTALVVVNLNTNTEKTIYSGYGEPFNKVVAYYEKNNLIVIAQNTDHVYTISTAQDTKINAQLYSHPIDIARSTQLLSGICVVNLAHPDVKDLSWCNIIEIDNIIYVGGFDSTNRSMVYCKWLDMQEISSIIDRINLLTDLSIEQLYLLTKISSGRIHGTLKKMTLTEKGLFESIPIDDQNLFYTFFAHQPTKSFTIEHPNNEKEQSDDTTSDESSDE